MTTLFISDLHLDPAQPDITAAFLTLLQGPALQAEALYILGDLFEVWIGDDDDTPFNHQIIAAIAAVTAQGIPTYFMRGNRDILVGKRFARETGMTLLSDPTVIDLYGTPTLLMHGDTLCTNDVKYQRYRQRSHHPLFKAIAYTIPLSLRRKIAKKMRAKSMDHYHVTDDTALDAVQMTIESAMQEYQVTQLIHGHTHRPNTHHFTLNETPATRIVLGAWHDGPYVLYCTSAGMQVTQITS